MSCNSEITAAVAFYGLADNAANTTVSDLSGSGNTATLAGGKNTSTVSTANHQSASGYAFAMDGSADYISCPTQTFAGEFTLAFRAKRGAVTGFDFISGYTAGSEKVGFGSVDDSFFIRVVSGGASQTVAIGADDNNWHHYAITRDASNIVAFVVDGSTVSADVFSGAVSGSIRINLLATDQGITNPFIGDIAEIYLDDSVADVGELSAGREPAYVSGATLSSVAAYNCGTWDSQGNGSISSYEWVIANTAGTVLASGTGQTGTASTGAASGAAYLLVRTSNAGGYDVGDYATRTSGYGSADDGYYEVASATLSGGGADTLPRFDLSRNAAQPLTRSLTRSLTELPDR